MRGAEPVVRRLRPADTAAVRALAGDAVPAWALHEAIAGAANEGAEPELRALVAHLDGAPSGVIVYGPVAGAVGAARVLGVAVGASVRGRGVGAALCGGMLAELASERVRLVVAEVADDARAAAGRALLERRGGFREVARVADYVRDGTALVILRRDLRP